jgi:hypothetical protein
VRYEAFPKCRIIMTVKIFSDDAYRRPVADAVTTLGSSVDDAVRKIARSYTLRGALEKVTSLDSSNNVLNEVKLWVRCGLDEEKRRELFWLQ